MTPQTKIATCCYCGTRAALVLRGKERHELACSACGAPLHDLKLMPVRAAAPEPVARKARKTYVKPAKSYAKPSKSRKKPKKSKRKSRMSGFFEEAFDFIEDIFD